MFRIPYNSPFLIHFEFVDCEGLPVSLQYSELDFVLFTRPAAPPFKAHLNFTGCVGSASLIDNSTACIQLIHHHLFPGKLKCSVRIRGVVESDGVMPHPVVLDLTPDVPVELIEPHHFHLMPPGCHHDFHGGYPPHEGDHYGQPVKVRCRINMRAPRFVRLVTHDELVNEIQNHAVCMCPENSELASIDDIKSILDKFNTQQDH